jgi:ribonuclease R
MDKYEQIIYEIAKITSECERRADEAERDVDDLFKSRYMKKHIGEEFEGVVSGVTSFGVFVELPNTVEGLIKLDTLPPASYDFDKKSYTISSKKLSFHLGERVRIMVAGVDSANRKVEFIFINKP